jgi:hypothetical protein
MWKIKRRDFENYSLAELNELRRGIEKEYQQGVKVYSNEWMDDFHLYYENLLAKIDKAADKNIDEYFAKNKDESQTPSAKKSKLMEYLPGAVAAIVAIPVVAATIKTALASEPAPTPPVLHAAVMSASARQPQPTAEHPGHPGQVPLSNNTPVVVLPDGRWFAWDGFSDFNAPDGTVIYFPGEPVHTQLLQRHNQQGQTQRPQHQGPPAVRLDIAFPNENPRTVENPTRALEPVIRNHVQQAMTMQRPLGIDGSTISPQQQQWSDSLVRAMIEALPNDETILASPVGVEGWAAHLTGITIRTFTMENQGDLLGIWDPQTQTAWIATHYRNENGRIMARSEDEAVRTLGFESLVRVMGAGSRLGNSQNEHITGIERQDNHPGRWALYSGFYNRIGEILGLENLLEIQFEGREGFVNGFDQRIPELNPNFNWDFDMMYRTIEGMDTILRDQSLTQEFSRNINSRGPWIHFEDMMNLFYRATDPQLSQQQRNQAANTFNQRLQQVHSYVVRNNIENHLIRETVATPVLDWAVPFYHPEHGVQSRSWFEQLGIPLVETREQTQDTGLSEDNPLPQTDDISTIQLTIGSIVATINNTQMELAAAPFIGEGGRTMIPVRFIADAMGALTDWNSATQTVTIFHESVGTIFLVVGEALPDGMGTPEIRAGRTFIPVGFIVSAMGGEIDWNAATQTVTITLAA